jgi:hypothetical protein
MNPFGPHRVTVEGERVRLKFVGKATYAETVAFHELLAGVLERGRCFVLVDLTELAGVDPKARRYIGEWNRSHRITAGAAFGASLTGRAFVTLLLNAIRLMNSSAPEIYMARDESEARQWLAARGMTAS